MFRTMFVFSGQGGQRPNMGRDLYEAFPVVRDTYEQAAEVLGYSPLNLTASHLSINEYAQPAIMTFSYACYKLLEENEINAEYMAGFSLGELTALAAAGAIPFHDALRLAQLRGNLSRHAVAPSAGALSTILGTTAKHCETACRDADGNVACAMYNSSEQIVIGGETAAVERAGRIAVERGATKALFQRNAVPIHTALMKPIESRMREVLSVINIRRCQMPVLSGREALPFGGNIADTLAAQLTTPVRWDMICGETINLGIERIIELGPGKILSSSLRKANRFARIFEVEDATGFLRVLIGR